MSQKIVEQLAKIGIKAEATAEDKVKMTLAQFAKAQDALGEKAVKQSGLNAKEGRILAKIDEQVLSTAVANHVKAKAPSDVTISSKTVYSIVVNEGSEVVNVVDSAEWESDTQTGWIRVNGTLYQITTGRAKEFYNVGDESDPDRVVYILRVPVGGGTYDSIVSYGVSNLIKKVASFDERIG